MTWTQKHAGFVTLGLILGLTIGCAGPTDSPEARQELAGELARLSVELGSLDRLLEDGAEMAWSSSADTIRLELGRELTGQEQGQVQRILRTVLSEFVTAELWEETVTRVYAENFTAGELDSMLEFYSSPAGRKSLQLQGKLTQQVDAAVEQALEARIDEFIARVDEELALAFPGLGSGAAS